VRRLAALSVVAALGLLLATLLTSSAASGLQEPPPPPPTSADVDEPDPRRPEVRFFDPRLIGPGWLRFEGAVDSFSPSNPLEAPVLNAVKVVAGFNHSCVLTDAGGVRCWGDNYFGQLGDGTRTFRMTPVDVVGLTSGVLDISSSHNHTCALTEATGVRCWGYNVHGELGNGSTSNSLVPVDAYGLQSGVAGISAGGFHTCVIMWNGGLKCWGANWHGQVGDDSIHDRYTPVDVVELTSGTIGLTTGKFHTCAVKTNRQVKCWGYNEFGQQGNGSTVDNHIPRKVIGLGDGVRAVYAGGLHTCAWTLEDKIKCWGDNSVGQLGMGGIEMATVPQRVDGLTGLIVDMSLGGFHTCSVTIDGGMKCWGNNWAGQLGNTGTTNSSWPTDVVYLPGWINSAASGDSHTCATTVDGIAVCWGSNGIGQLGIATSGISPDPQNVIGLNGQISDASGGAQHACALTNSGGIQCWGNLLTGSAP
jgi:alpha-tubulin suppressor-like RCC1 family protein